MSRSSQKRNIAIFIGGMTCSSCELLLERKIKNIPGVKSVDISHRSGIAKITAKEDETLDLPAITAAVEKAGYAVLQKGHATSMPLATDRNKWLEIGAALLIIFAAYKLLQTFDLISLAPSTSGILSVGGIFLIGLVAGTSSCLAVTGGLLLAMAARYNETHQSESTWQKFQPLLHFNVGRLLSYFVLGGIVGVLGQSITLSPRMSGFMTILVAVIMLWLALTILAVIPKGSFPIRPPKKLSRWIADLSESKHPAAPLVLGALTFFLPCGFTQSLQLAALASGSFLTGAMTMFIFALGTLPSLLGLSAISTAARGNFSRLFLRFSGALVLVLALFNLRSGIALTGLNFPSAESTELHMSSAPVVKGGSQEISMTVTPYGTYEPSILTIKAGVPVRWKVDGTEAFGCTSILTIPSLNITKALGKGENIVTFTAPEPGKLAFMCSMGMVRGSFNVI